MNISNYLGMPYDIHNESGVNCWTLYKLIKKQEQGINVVLFKAPSANVKKINDVFSSALSDGCHGHFRVDKPEDFDLVLMTKETKRQKIYHCGIWYNGMVMHARGSGQNGQVWYQESSELSEYSLEFWRNE